MNLENDFVKTYGIIRLEDMQMYCVIRGLVISKNDKHKDIKLKMKRELNAFLKHFFVPNATLNYYTHTVITDCWFSVTFTEEILKEMPKEFWTPFKLTGQ